MLTRKIDAVIDTFYDNTKMALMLYLKSRLNRIITAINALTTIHPASRDAG